LNERKVLSRHGGVGVSLAYDNFLDLVDVLLADLVEVVHADHHLDRSNHRFAGAIIKAEAFLQI
jgi:hypothetical protein